MAERLFYCDTCDVHLTGQQPALQHYNGSKHRKKEAVKLVRSNAVFGSTTDHLTTESERHTGSLNLLGSASGYPDDGMRSENTLKSLEGAQTCSVVMVPSLNPDLPPVPVTMAENILPQTEFEFDGSGGSCYLCDIVLTSQQHADQHLSGQKHLKAKKRWEARREQLQMTVSGLCPSMKSKPIAMCQPLVCEMPVRDCVIGSITKHNTNRPVLPPIATAAESTDVVDGMQWFSCEVCNKKMNTVEMLKLHRQSPAHLKKVERQQLGASSGDNTIWQSCPTCQKKLNSPTQLEIHMANHRRSSCLSNYPPACPEGRTTPLVAMPGIQWYHCDMCNKFMNTALQLELHQQSPAHQKKAALRDSHLSDNIGDNTVWQTCPVCDKRLNSMKQLDIHMNSHSVQARSLLCSVPRGDVDTENQLISTADTERVLKNVNMSLLSAAENIDPPIEFGEKVDVKNLNTLVNQLQLQEEAPQGDVGMSEGVVRSDSTDGSQLRRISTQQLADTLASQAASQTKFTSNIAAAADGDDDAVLMLNNRVNLAKTDSHDPSHDEIRQISSENLVSRTTRQAEDNSAAAAADDDDDAEKLVTDDDLITSGCCASVGCVYHCELCDVHLSGDEPKNMHLTGTKHIACRQKAEETTPAEHNPFSPSFSFFCRLCNVPFNTTKDKRQHERGQQHISKSLRCVQAPHRLLPDVILPTDADKHCCMPDSLVTSKPRSYQEELYFKTLVAESICFLPTGTGKTLVSVMLMSRLLMLNPRHSVVFVVDRILLALQQSKVIKKELGDKLFSRWNEERQATEQRKLRMAMLCGAKGDLQGAAVWQQDIIVITAAFYVNVLETGSLRWADNCLVVIDEVHHCLKDHPYSRLIQLCGHSQLDVTRRPRLLGLTASPAGQETPASTVLMLQRLLRNLGVERLVTVERNVDELALYQSTATLDIRLISYSSSEQQLRSELRCYVLRCYLQLCERSDSDSLRQLDVFSFLSPENLEDSASDLDVEVVQSLCDVVDTIEPKDADSKLVVSFLSAHVKVLCQAADALDSLGLENACNELALLLRSDYVASFSRAREAGLPCDGLESLVSVYLEAENRQTAILDDGVIESVKRSATYVQLVHELEIWWDSRVEGAQPGMALVLVRQRSMASVLSELLGCCVSLQRRQMRVVHIVGHGSGGSDGGMSVQQQSRTLHDIQHGKYNVIVATSVAEEGVDLPECELVIQLDAPDCVRALVQVRGRARKTGSKFIAFCRDAAQKSQLNSLLQHERHMIDAVQQIINSNSP